MQRRLTVLAFCLFAGCLWRGYATIMAVHVDVLTQTAAKLCAVVESGRGLSPQGMAEYVYPAQRARQFLGQSSHHTDRQSYQQFTQLVERYEALVHEVDAARAGGHDWQQVVPQLTAECAALGRLADVVRGDLQHEG